MSQTRTYTADILHGGPLGRRETILFRSRAATTVGQTTDAMKAAERDLGPDADVMVDSASIRPLEGATHYQGHSQALRAEGFSPVGPRHKDFLTGDTVLHWQRGRTHVRLVVTPNPGRPLMRAEVSVPGKDVEFFQDDLDGFVARVAR
jgi:hypothetical protein